MNLKASIYTTILSVLLAGIVWAEPLKVVTSIPDLADFTRQVGGDRVEVYSIASGREDPHNVPMRPSAITRLQQADVFIVMGLEMEHAFAPALQAESRNPKIQRSGPGFLDLSGGVHPIEVPTSIDRSQGEVHPKGNPHYNLDPVYGQMMVTQIARKLGELDPAGANSYASNAEAYNTKLSAMITPWRARLKRGVRFVSYHPDLGYFAARFGLQQIGTIQPKPGIEPGPRYIDELVARMQRDHAQLIVKESFYSDRVPNELAKRTGARVVSVPIMVNGVAAAKDYLSFIGTVVEAFATAP